MRDAICVDCGQGFSVASSSGPLPARCEIHKRVYVNRLQRKWKAAQRSAEPAREVTCIDCGVALEWSGRGRPRLRCDSCISRWTQVDGRRRVNLWNEANRDYVRAKGKVLYRQNRKKVSAAKLEEHYRRRYGLTRADVDRMTAEQGGKCLVCGTIPNPEGPYQSRRLHVDHCHATARVRGLLCGNCNTMIGLAKEDPDRLLAAAAYLRHAA